MIAEVVLSTSISMPLSLLQLVLHVWLPRWTTHFPSSLAEESMCQCRRPASLQARYLDSWYNKKRTKHQD